MSEKILVVDLRDTRIYEAFNFNGVSTNLDKLNVILTYLEENPLQDCFEDRDKMEKDPSFLQIIPYTILQHKKKYCIYTRGNQSGEKRLVGNKSIGLGGHIIESDAEEVHKPFGMILKACQREICEEVNIHGSILEQRRIGIIRDCSNEVGTVHLGIVFLWVLEHCRLQSNEKYEILETEFLTLPELLEQASLMESWSKLCLPLLAIESARPFVEQ